MAKTRNETAVGIFVVMGTLLLAVLIFCISGVYLFKSGYSVTVIYHYVSILDKGAPVRMAGVRVGEVSQVTLLYNEQAKETQVQVKLFIRDEIQVRQNYQFHIQGTHILSEPHIEISPLPGDEPVIKDGAVIRGVEPVPIEELLAKAHGIATNLDAIVASIRGTVESQEAGASLKDLIRNLSALSASMEKVLSGSEGDLKDTITNIKTSSDSLSRILEKVDKGEGTVGKLLTQDELYQEMKAFVAEIKAHPWRLLKKDSGTRKKRFLFF